MNCRTFSPKILAREEKATTTTIDFHQNHVERFDADRLLSGVA